MRNEKTETQTVILGQRRILGLYLNFYLCLSSSTQYCTPVSGDATAERKGDHAHGHRTSQQTDACSYHHRLLDLRRHLIYRS